MRIDIRRIVAIVDVVPSDPFGWTCEPITRAAGAVVLRNPRAGRFVEDLAELFDAGGAVGETLRVRCSMAVSSFTRNMESRCRPRSAAASP